LADLQEGDRVATRGTDQLRAGTEIASQPAGPEIESATMETQPLSYQEDYSR
jgi:hypothetical protein